MIASVPAFPAEPAEHIDSARRGAFASLLGIGALWLSQPLCAASPGMDAELTEQYALLQRAYRTTDAELMRRFYSEDVVFASEGAPPIIGIESMIAAARLLLPKRRDIEAEVLRAVLSEQGDMACHLVKLKSFPRNADEAPRGATALLIWQRQATGWRCGAEMLLLQDIGSMIRTPTAGSKPSSAS